MCCRKVAEKCCGRVEVTSNFRNVLRQLATWKCVARQVARAGSKTSNIELSNLLLVLLQVVLK